MAAESAIFTLLLKVLPQVIAGVVKAIKAAVDGGKATAEELRAKPITVSIAFGGGEGEALQAQIEIEADLPE